MLGIKVPMLLLADMSIVEQILNSPFVFSSEITEDLRDLEDLIIDLKNLDSRDSEGSQKVVLNRKDRLELQTKWGVDIPTMNKILSGTIERTEQQNRDLSSISKVVKTDIIISTDTQKFLGILREKESNIEYLREILNAQRGNTGNLLFKGLPLQHLSGLNSSLKKDPEGTFSFLSYLEDLDMDKIERESHTESYFSVFSDSLNELLVEKTSVNYYAKLFDDFISSMEKSLIVLSDDGNFSERSLDLEKVTKDLLSMPFPILGVDGYYKTKIKVYLDSLSVLRNVSIPSHREELLKLVYKALKYERS